MDVQRVYLAAVLVTGVLGFFDSAHAANHRTTNFSVDAPNAQAAKAVAERAEASRKTIAEAWLGRQLPNWSRPCPVQVTLTNGEAGGLTTFDFAQGRVTGQIIKVEGRLDRILASALPHEVTHTIFAAFFGGPMPRWADEGASLLSEDQRELDRHEEFVAHVLAKGTELPLGRLFRMEDYPADLMGFYGQGYSVSRFLVEIGGRPRFLQFVRDGMKGGWDQASRAHYGLADSRELDRAWRAWYRVDVVEAKRSGTPLVVRAQSGESGNVK
jgi:hypothetical protein